MLTWLDPNEEHEDFPPLERALKDPNGLLAVGGDLSPARLLNAYRRGIFPWYEDGQPILWWSPDPRAILFTNKIKISRSLRKTLRHKPYSVSFDLAFGQVISACAEPRKNANGTWITRDMETAYLELHRQGHAHSVEIWDKEKNLVGGLYGVLLKNIFCGESMFNRQRDMSKIALVSLAEWLNQKNINAIDCQLSNPHLTSLGAESISRTNFSEQFLTA
jgi:leucyl/phenylalanyl-tRNA--protein transferase